jgi:hypothetical protein
MIIDVAGRFQYFVRLTICPADEVVWQNKIGVMYAVIRVSGIVTMTAGNHRSHLFSIYRYVEIIRIA